jgi:hypothetical protein
MTSLTERASTMKAARDAHDQPCWCSNCHALTLETLLDERASILLANIRGNYDPGYERVLADELFAAIPLAERDRALRHLLWCKAELAALGLLDECRTETYEAAAALADILYDAISAEHNEGWALHELILNEICDRQELRERLTTSAS